MFHIISTIVLRQDSERPSLWLASATHAKLQGLRGVDVFYRNCIIIGNTKEEMSRHDKRQEMGRSSATEDSG